MNLALNIASGLLTLLAYIPYIVSITRGKTKPNIVSWWLWFSVGALLLFTYYATGAQAAIGLMIGAVSGQFVIALLSLRYGKGGTARVDYVSFAGAAGAGLLWWLTSSPFLPHYLIIFIDFLAWFPTFRKTLTDPGSEDFSAWALWSVAAALSVINISAWTPENIAYPFYITISDGIVAVLILRHLLKKRAP